MLPGWEGGGRSGATCSCRRSGPACRHRRAAGSPRPVCRSRPGVGRCR
ncbi:SWIM zinc finger family protein [Streptomyces sp. NPDC051133]